MKNIFIYIAFLAISLTVSSCSDETVSPVSDSPMLTIHLSSSDLQTKAPMAGVEQLNENLIRTIHYFLYPMGKTNEPALLHNSTKPITTSKQTLESFNVPLDETLLSKLFVYPQEKCKVFLIVNLPEGTVIPTDTSIDNLKKIAVEASFSSLPVGSFVMTGEGEATLQSRTLNPAAEGNINVDRVASKLTLSITTSNSYVDGDVTWTSRPEDMKVSFYNCVNNAELSGTPVDAPSRFNITDRTFDVTSTSGVDVSECTCDPFYSYPVEWTPGSEYEPYFFIMLPWTDETGDSTDDGVSYRPCYYKVILSDTHLDRNNWYNINLTLGVLGSFNETEPTVVVSDVTYYVLNWRDASDNASDADVNADIHGARYLVVDQDVYYVYNQNSLSIPFLSSHDCEIVDMSTNRVKNQATITYPDYSKDTPNENAAYAWNSSTWNIGIDGTDILFSHMLRNDLNAGKGNYDYAPYTIRFRIRHLDNVGKEKYFKDITIIQYPAMLITCNPNRKLNGGYDNSGVVDGGVSVNNGDYYGGVHGLTGGNKNPNMYVISTTVLPANTNDILADPRSSNVNNLSNWDPAIASAPGIENRSVNRRLTNYYPTIETQDGWNIIAPKFRIASSYGVTNSITYANAQKRCASYQEDGYPAGRWRLPTQAEIEFIVRLSADGVIPVLFSPGNNYWCAGGRANPIQGGGVTITQSTGNNNTTGPVRCVYDEWYWEKSAYPRLPGNTVTFTWGDAAR